MNSKSREMLDTAVRVLNSQQKQMRVEDVVLMIYNLGRIDEALTLAYGEEAIDVELAQQGTMQ